MVEKLFCIIFFIFKGVFKKYKLILVKDVVKGMYIIVLWEELGIYIYNLNEIIMIE